jgi:hypothetical protein
MMGILDIFSISIRAENYNDREIMEQCPSALINRRPEILIRDTATHNRFNEARLMGVFAIDI